MFNHLNLRVDLVEGLLVKYSVQRGLSGHQDGDIVERQMESHFPRRIPPTEKKWKQDSVLTVASTIKKRMYTTWFQTFAMFCMLYVFFWVIPRSLNFWNSDAGELPRRKHTTMYTTWFQTFAMFRMLYVFFWVIPRSLNFWNSDAGELPRRKHTTMYTTVNTVIVLCASMGVSRLTIQG